MAVPRAWKVKGWPFRSFHDLVLGRDDREEDERGDLEEIAQRNVGLLDDRVGRADADIHLPADDGLDRQLLLGERGELVVQPALLGALERDQECERLFGDDVAERDANDVLGCGGGGA